MFAPEIAKTRTTSPLNTDFACVVPLEVISIPILSSVTFFRYRVRLQSKMACYYSLVNRPREPPLVLPERFSDQFHLTAHWGYLALLPFFLYKSVHISFSILPCYPFLLFQLLLQLSSPFLLRCSYQSFLPVLLLPENLFLSFFLVFQIIYVLSVAFQSLLCPVSSTYIASIVSDSPFFCTWQPAEYISVFYTPG